MYSIKNLTIQFKTNNYTIIHYFRK